ncbi:MAG: chemotaxis protein CheW [Pirellulaceae bacterium]
MLPRKNMLNDAEIQLATFKCGELFIAIEISRICEINRIQKITPVPESSEFVVGAVNLRGDLATMLNLKRILGIDDAFDYGQSRNVMIQHEDGIVGLTVDGVADVITVQAKRLIDPPPNIHGVDRKFFRKILPDEPLIMLLDLDAVINYQFEVAVYE